MKFVLFNYDDLSLAEVLKSPIYNLTDDDLFIDELMVQIQNSITKLDQETIEKCAVLINRYATDCSTEI